MIHNIFLIPSVYFKAYYEFKMRIELEISKSV